MSLAYTYLLVVVLAIFLFCKWQTSPVDINLLAKNLTPPLA